MLYNNPENPVWMRTFPDVPGSRVLPIPAVLDSGAAVLLHLLLDDQPSRPVILDAAGLRELCAVGALLLAAALRSHSREGVPPRIVNLSDRLRRELSRHPLIDFVERPHGSSLFRIAREDGLDGAAQAERSIRR